MFNEENELFYLIYDSNNYKIIFVSFFELNRKR